MNRLSMEDVRGILAPYETYLQEVFHSAFSDWWELPNRSRLFRRTRATYIHNAAVNHAMDRLGNLPTVDILPRHETAYFVFDNKVLLRFKKADELWNSSNIETQTAISYHDPQETISGLPNIERVEVAYRLNRLETQIAQIMVIARGKDFKPLWKYGLSGDANAFEALALPIQEATEHTPTAESSLRVPDTGLRGVKRKE